MTFTQLVRVLCLAASAITPVLAAPIVFNASGNFPGGGTLSGTVTIDTTTGTVLSTDLSATVYQTFLFSTNVGGTPNYANSGLFVIAADYAGGYPVALVGLPQTSLVNYAGGARSSKNKNIFYQRGNIFLCSGQFH